jgi:hypothetical protein
VAGVDISGSLRWRKFEYSVIRALVICAFEFDQIQQPTLQCVQFNIV